MNIIQFFAITNTCKVLQIHCGLQKEGSLRWISCWYSNTRTRISLHVWDLFWGERSRTLPLGSWPCQLVFATSRYQWSQTMEDIGSRIISHIYSWHSKISPTFFSHALSSRIKFRVSATPVKVLVPITTWSRYSYCENVSRKRSCRPT